MIYNKIAAIILALAALPAGAATPVERHGRLHDRVQKAVDSGLPVFMAECAAMEHTGDGKLDPESWKEWMDLADRNRIGWIAWSVSDKLETCSMLHPTAPSEGMLWSESDLKPWAKMVQEALRH